MAKKIEPILWVVIGVAGALLLARFGGMVRFILPFLAALLLMVLLVILLRQWWQFRQLAQFQRTPQGQLQRQLAECQSRLTQNEAEMAEIREHLADLQRSLRQDSELAPITREKLTTLLQGFQRELDLRTAKAQFFATCLARLEALEKRHALQEILRQKQERLLALRANEYTDLATLEQIKTQIELEQDQFDAIDALYREALLTHSASAMAVLQQNLEKMTAALETSQS